MTVQEAALKEFSRRIIADYCWGYGEPDGGDVQELAERLGLIEPHAATEDDAKRFECDVGDTVYRFAEWLKE